jgi:hypothetical protein
MPFPVTRRIWILPQILKNLPGLGVWTGMIG